MKRVLLSLAVMLALMTALPTGSAQDPGIYQTSLVVEVWEHDMAFVPGETHEVSVAVNSYCAFVPGIPNEKNIEKIEHITLEAEVTNPDLTVTLSESEYTLDHDAFGCTYFGAQLDHHVVRADVHVDANATAGDLGTLIVFATSSWAPDEPAKGALTRQFAQVGSLDITAEPVSLATDGTGTASIVVSNMANFRVFVRPDATLRTLFGPQPEIPAFALEVGETSVLVVPLRVEDGAGATGALEVRFEVADVDAPDQRFDPIHLRIPVDVGGGPAPLALDVAEAPAPLLSPLLASLAVVGVLMRRRF